MARVIHFEIAADDIARAKKFYEIFDWEITDSNMPGSEYWLATTGKEGDPGINGAIMPRTYSPKQAVRTTISVDDLDAMKKKVIAAGGTVEEERDPIPGVGRYVNATDTEGNTFGMLQPDKK